MSHFFFFTATAPTEIYTLSLHDALPISRAEAAWRTTLDNGGEVVWTATLYDVDARSYFVLAFDRMALRVYRRSEEHTSELQSQFHLVCRLLLEKKKKKHNIDDAVISVHT